MTKAHFITLGCAKNEVDTNRMKNHLNADGGIQVSGYEDADVVVLNTCGFLQSAVQESIDTAFEIMDDMDKTHRDVPLIFCGCVPSRFGSELQESFPEVARFVPLVEEDNIAAIIREVVGEEQLPEEKREVLRSTESAFSYVKISDGCDRFCSFCAIPNIRGRYHSRTSEEILSEVDALVATGTVEIVLIAQDSGIWGSDWTQENADNGRNVAWLLNEVAKHVDQENGRVRILYIEPWGLTQDVLDVMRDNPRVMKYVDIPFQHCSEHMLDAMNREGSRPEFEEIVTRARETVPGIAIRTTMMAGFPSETDDDQENALDFMKKMCFDYCSVFQYSPEDGTTGYEMEQVDSETAMRRTQELHDVADDYGFASASSRIGKIYDVLIDSAEQFEGGSMELCGRTYFQSPDSDGVVHLPGYDGAIGETVKVRIVDSVLYELIGEVIND